MRSYLIENNFIQQPDGNTWVRDGWTIRFYRDVMEIYDNIENGGHYYVGEKNITNLLNALDDINAGVV